MYHKIFVIGVVSIAVILGLLVSFILSPEHLDVIVPISRFFDVMLPVLAVGALLKYICKCERCPQCNSTCCTCNKPAGKI